MNNMTISERANTQQREAITSTEGPLLIIAGPGSGKTFTLVERIIYLITERNLKPEQLMVVTFTDKAAAELTTRVSNRMNEIGIRFNLNEMYLGTFHAICLRWLREHREFTRLKRNFMMMDQFDQQYFIYQNLREFDEIEDLELLSSTRNNWKRTQDIAKWVNVVSEEALDPVLLIASNDAEVRVLGRCALRYQGLLTEANALDFSTIQLEALHLLRNHPQILEELQSRISHVMVDEYQDTNTIQELLLQTLMSGEQPNLCVVGDDDQGLYRFRGATIRNILQFRTRYPTCKQVSLETNYRSHRDIIQFYNRWMSDQPWTHKGQLFRYEKTIRPQEKDFPDVPTVMRVGSGSIAGWHDEVLNFLHALRDQGHLTDWNQVAFLFKSVKNERVTGLAEFLEANDIPVYSPRSNQFFNREEIRLMIGALIFLFPQFPQVRKWADDAHLDIWNYYDNDCVRLFLNEARKPENRDLVQWGRRLAAKHQVLTENTDYGFTGLFYELLQFPLFSRYLEEDFLRDGLMNSRPMRNLGLLSQMLNKFEYLHNITVLNPVFLEQNLQGLFNRFLRFLYDGGINEYEDDGEYAPSGHVSFLTIHQSKGMEFPVVIVGSLYASPRKQYTALDEILEGGYLARPAFEPLDQTKYYDFRRLYYTAYSRAQNLLVLSTSEVLEGRGQRPSKHFRDYYDELPYWDDDPVDLSRIELEQVKEVNLKREYSFTSHITVFENCAEQYRFYRELEFAAIRRSPILFGTLVHQTIEDIHKTVLRGEEQKLSEDQVATWFDTNYAYLTRKERVYLAPFVKEKALEHVIRYYWSHKQDWSHIREAEVDVSLVKDDYILTGTVDLIAGEEDTVELIDFKSENKLDVNDPKDREKLNQYRRQLEVYAHIVEERTGMTVSKTHLYYTGEDSGSPYITFEKNERSIEQTIASFDEVVSRIEEKDFAISERPPKLCKNCDMLHYCDRKNWNFRRQE